MFQIPRRYSVLEKPDMHAMMRGGPYNKKSFLHQNGPRAVTEVLPASGKVEQLVFMLAGWSASSDYFFETPGWGAPLKDGAPTENPQNNIAIMERLPYLLPNTAFVILNGPRAVYNPEKKLWGYYWFPLPQQSADPDASSAEKKIYHHVTEMPLLLRIAMPWMVRRASRYIRHVIYDAMRDYQIGPDRVAIVGHSQGGIMALYTALSMSRPIALAISANGMYLGGIKPRSLPREMLLMHSAADPVVDPRYLDVSVRNLRALLPNMGQRITTCDMHDVGHAISNEGIARVTSTLQRAFHLPLAPFVRQPQRPPVQPEDQQRLAAE